mgnify:CR=1 FL=1
MSLGDNNAEWSPNYLDAKEVMELFHVRHFEFSGEEGLDLVDVNWMLTSNHQIIHGYDDDHWASKIVSYHVHLLF